MLLCARGAGGNSRLRGCSLWYNPSVTLRVPPPFTQERHPRKPHIFLKYIIAEKRKKFKTYFIRLSVRINAKTGGGRKMQQTGRPNGDALTVRQLGILAAGALAAGFLNGLLGAGGGVVLYFTLGAIGGARGSKENLVLSSTAVAFYCLVSLHFYRASAALDTEDILSVGVPAALGGIIGAYLLRHIPQSAMRKLFSVVVFLGGILMLLK